MGVFNKFSKGKRDNQNERNEICNKELKETLANTALSTFKQGEHYDNLAYITVEFGYFFDIDEHGIEALFKIITIELPFILLLKSIL